jgi:antitoxin component YwqK of YwqJK toxin-antitoxin module
MPLRRPSALLAAVLAAPWLALLVGCGEQGTVHVVRYPDGRVKETWTQKAPEGGLSVREGKFRSFHADGSRESESEFRAGRRTGPARVWSKAGARVFEGEFRDDFLVSEKRWDESGQVTVDRVYSTTEAEVKALGPDGDSLEVSETCAWLEEDGARERHGLCRMAYPGGRTLSERHYHRGRLHGPVKAWHPDGTPWMEGAYSRGLPAGAWKTFGKDGKPLWSAAYAKGEPSGEWREWFPDGKPKSKSAYRGGKPEGPYQEWYRTGKPRLAGSRKGGLREGLETAWYADGGKLYEAAYRAGRLEGDFRQWHPGGRLRLQCRFKDGRKHGISRTWHREGGLMDLSTYREGRLDGLSKSFAPDGRLLVTKVYKAGDLASDSKAKELIELLGAENVKVPVGVFGFYWGMTAAECRGALGLLQAREVRQSADVISARATVLADRMPSAARLRLRFNAQGELWQVNADIARSSDDHYALCGRLEAEMGADLGRAVMRRAAGEGNHGALRMSRKREWGRFSVTTGTEIPVRQELPVVTAEGDAYGKGEAFRFTLSNHLFREYVNPANASVTPPDWPEDTFLAGR